MITEVSHGVQQGSVFGPIPVILYMLPKKTLLIFTAMQKTQLYLYKNT